jgi:TolA-binding protein
MKRSDCRNDLVMRSRRQTLSGSEQALLDAHLVMCESCRFDLRIGADFDEVSGLHPGYEMSDQRVAAAVLKKVHPSVGWRGGRPSSWLKPAVVLGLVAATMAAWAGVRVHRGEVAGSKAATVAAKPVDACTLGVSCADALSWPAAQPEPLVLAVPASSEEAEPSVAVAPTSRRHGGARRSGRAQETAAIEDTSAPALFERATLERQRKHAAEAIELYAELQRRYPLSMEALVSRVSLGRLLVDHGMPADANGQFDAYLTAMPQGTLAPEALFGKARALDALGRTDDAREVWRRVATSLPGSAYAAEARRHLDAHP